MGSSLVDQVAVVTGASSGIGAATALAMGAAGARVVLVARRVERLQELARKLTELSARSMIVKADVAVELDANRVIDAAVAEFGRIDILVNNAGVMLPGLIDSSEPKDFRRMLDVNVLGLMFLTRFVVPVMRTQRRGTIVNVSSTAGRETRPAFSGYDASKYAVVGFSDAVRRDVHKDNIRVICLEPGAVATELVDNITDDTLKAAARDYLATITSMTAEDVADVIVFAVTRPSRVQLNEILMRPTAEI